MTRFLFQKCWASPSIKIMRVYTYPSGMKDKIPNMFLHFASKSRWYLHHVCVRINTVVMFQCNFCVTAGLEWFDVTEDAGSTPILCSRSSARRGAKCFTHRVQQKGWEWLGSALLEEHLSSVCCLVPTTLVGGFSPLVGTSCGFFGKWTGPSSP